MISLFILSIKTIKINEKNIEMTWQNQFSKNETKSVNLINKFSDVSVGIFGAGGRRGIINRG